jgi:hypothetical protein
MTLHLLLGSCKAHYAASVKEILPSAWPTATIARKASASLSFGSRSYLRPILRDRRDGSGIIGITSFVALHGGIHEHSPGRQTPSPAPPRRTPRPSGTSERSLIPSARVLRSTRSTPGQVRDASTRSGRGRLRHSSRGCFRLLTARVLPSVGRLSMSRLTGLAAAASRTTPRPQTLRRRCGFRPSPPPRQPGTTQCGFVRLDPGRLRSDRASTQSRKSLVTPTKKGALNPAAQLARCEEPWTTRYEDLRHQVLEQGSAPACSGWGCALVTCHGLAAWMEAWPRYGTTASGQPPAKPTTPLPPPSLSAFLRPQVTHILVNMILSIQGEVLS